MVCVHGLCCVRLLNDSVLEGPKPLCKAAVASLYRCPAAWRTSMVAGAVHGFQLHTCAWPQHTTALALPMCKHTLLSKIICSCVGEPPSMLTLFATQTAHFGSFTVQEDEVTVWTIHCPRGRSGWVRDSCASPHFVIQIIGCVPHNT